MNTDQNRQNDLVARTGSSGSALPIPRTAVNLGISDPVERARAELKAALAAIEEKSNLPRRAARATDRALTTARGFARRNPTGALAAVVGAAAMTGLAVWGMVRLYTR